MCGNCMYLPLTACGGSGSCPTALVARPLVAGRAGDVRGESDVERSIVNWSDCCGGCSRVRGDGRSGGRDGGCDGGDCCMVDQTISTAPTTSSILPSDTNDDGVDDDGDDDDNVSRRNNSCSNRCADADDDRGEPDDDSADELMVFVLFGGSGFVVSGSGSGTLSSPSFFATVASARERSLSQERGGVVMMKGCVVMMKWYV